MGYSLLSDELLLKAYNQAKKMNLDKDFIDLLQKEIALRKLSIKEKTP